jgi:16S rRNA (guanine527-N7)-methyltransferase
MNDFSRSFHEILGRAITETELQAFRVYEDELCEWNKKINLTAIRDRDEIQVKHFLDSLTCMTSLGGIDDLRLIDVGTGGGFPGLPIKICCPNLKLTLVDSVGKKLDFCRHLISKLNLQKVEMVQSRAEDLGQNLDYREKYDRAVSRAVASLPVLLEYLLPLLIVGGKAVIQKGENGPIELEDSTKALIVLGGKLEAIQSVRLPGVEDARYLITIQKISKTPPQYPRRVGIPSRKPLV